jgi:hypothetical protein
VGAEPPPNGDGLPPAAEPPNAGAADIAYGTGVGAVVLPKGEGEGAAVFPKGAGDGAALPPNGDGLGAAFLKPPPPLKEGWDAAEPKGEEFDEGAEVEAPKGSLGAAFCCPELLL